MVNIIIRNNISGNKQFNTTSTSSAGNINAMSSILPLTSGIEEPDTSYIISLDGLLEMGDAALGLKAVITSTNGDTRLGVINYILHHCKHLALEKASNPLTGKIRLTGLHVYFFSELKTISIVGEDVSARQRLLQDIYCEDNQGKRLLMKKIVPYHQLFNKDDSVIIDEDILLGKAPFEPSRIKDSVVDKLRSIPPPPTGVSRPSDKILINALDEEFHAAIKILKCESVIGVTAVGQSLGRGGILAWMAVATPKTIFLFDVVLIGMSEALKNGLGAVLSDTSIIKIIHDSRVLEDYLHHQHQFNLQNVFDTQASEVYLYMINHKGSMPSFVKGLQTLLVEYLDLPPQHLFYFRVREEREEEDETMWLERPLAEHLRDGLANSVIYLAELRQELVNLILVDLKQLTCIFLGALRDKPATMSQMVERQIVPPEVQRLGRRSIHNHVALHDPYITYSRHSFKVNKSAEKKGL